MLLQFPQHIVMIFVRRQLHAQLETRRFEQPHQRRQRRLATVTLVSRHHGPWHASALGQFGLAQTGLQPGVSQQASARGGHLVIDAHVHDCIPPADGADPDRSLVAVTQGHARTGYAGSLTADVAVVPGGADL